MSYVTQGLRYDTIDTGTIEVAVLAAELNGSLSPHWEFVS
jgi:hypothetical protein